MTLRNFDSELSTTLVKRGKDYFRDGQVAELEEKRSGIWTALAFGSDEYEVEIHLKGDQITETVCNCPFDGPVCKHAIGTLFAIRSETLGEELKPKKTGSAKPKSPSKKLTIEGRLELIRQRVPLPLLVDILLAEAAEDKDLRDKLFIQFADLWGESPLKVILKNIKSATSKSGRYGYIDFYASGKITKNLYGFTQEAEKTWSEGKTEIALGIALGLLEHVIPLFNSVDDSNGSLSDVVVEVFTQLNLWLDALPPEDLNRKNTIKMLQKLVEEGVGSGFDFQDNMLDLVCQFSISMDEKVWLLSYTQSKLTDKDDVGKYDYQKRRHVKNHVNALQICGKEREAHELKVKYRNQIHDFLQELFQEALENNQLDLAKKYINEGISNPEWPGYHSDWKTKLTNWYLVTGDRKNYLESLFDSVVNQRISQPFLKDLKTKMEPNEWLNFRLRWITTCRKYKARNGHDDGMKSTLLELLLEGQELDVVWEELKTLSFHFFESYSSHFLKTHNAEVVERYCKYVLHYTEKSQQRDRGTYKRMADYLLRIKKMGGIEQANVVRDTLLNTYRRSPALADELRAV